jgi:hypothetical protein
LGDELVEVDASSTAFVSRTAASSQPCFTKFGTWLADGAMRTWEPRLRAMQPSEGNPAKSSVTTPTRWLPPSRAQSGMDTEQRNEKTKQSEKELRYTYLDFSNLELSSYPLPDHLFLDRAPNLGSLISRWEINNFENCWHKSVRILEVLKLLLQQFLNSSSSRRDTSGPILGDLSKIR